MKPHHIISLLILVVSTFLAGGAHASSHVNSKQLFGPNALPTPPAAAPYTGYKGISIGAKQADVRTKIGQPKEASETQDFWVVSETESVQVFYAPDKTVSAIMVTYAANIDAAPLPLAIFGEAAEAKPDGSVFKMVRYPKAGYWISYNKIAGTEPTVMIAMQKL